MFETIVNSFDIWGTAQTQKSKGKKAGIDNISLHGINRLRELILELAVRGKLVEQNPVDEPANMLLETVELEKNRLIASGRIKKQTPLPQIQEDDKPFKIPNSWNWTRLRDLSANIHYGYTASANSNIQDIRLLRITDIQNDKVDWESVPGCEIKEDEIPKYCLENGDILIARTGGTIGKSYLVENINVKSVFASYLIRVQRLNGMYPEFIKVFLGSQLYWKQLYANSMGTGQPNVNGVALSNLIFPLPPLPEQHRIVAKVDELMALCDKLEQEQMNQIETHLKLVEALLKTLTDAKNAEDLKAAWQHLELHFDILFTTEESVELLKQTILQLAVMGKLVPQNPNDEPASVLLEKIEAEKQRLIKEGKIKKQKPLPEITEDEKPFELPEGWEWSRLCSISQINPRNEVDDKLSVSFVPMNLVYTSHKGEHGNENKSWEEVKKGYTNFADGDIGLAKITPCFENSKAVVFSNLINGVGAGTTELHIARPYGNSLNSRFVLLYLKSPHYLKLGESKMTGTAGQKRVPKDFFAKNPFPLPPYTEQNRIVKKVDELMSLCDQLKERIIAKQELKVKLADAVVEGAVN